MKENPRMRVEGPRRRRGWRWMVGGAVFLTVALLGGLHVLARVFLGCSPALPGTEKRAYGGPLALLAAARLPARVAGVVTIGSVSPGEEHPWADLRWLDGQLPAIRCPVLMLQGDRDAQVPDRNLAYLEARFAALGKSGKLQTRLFLGYNHFMMWEHPAEVNAAISDFLALSEASR